MTTTEPKPCLGCKRLYGHLNECTVKELHEALDRAVKEFGPDKVAVVYRSAIGDINVG